MSLRHGCWLFFIFLFLALPRPAASAEIKDWTLLVFLNGHNDLDSYGASNIRQMERVGSTEKVNIVVQWASLGAQDTKRLYITKSANPNQVTSPVVESLPPVNMGNPQSLVEFVRWAKERYPARHYFIDVWNHGSGWHRVSSRGSLRMNDISWDERFHSHITTKQLGAAIRQISRELGQKVDIYGSDACLMAMAEVAAEMKDSVDVFVGAEETEPGDGWPYDQLLAEWNAVPDSASAEQVGGILVREYVKAYSGGQFGKEEVTLSSMRLAAWPRFESAVRDLAGEMRGLSSEDRSAVMRVVGRTQSYQTSDYKDLYHFTQGISALGLRSIRPGSILELQRAVRALMVANGVSPGYKNSQGISIWLPESRRQFEAYADSYSALDFPRITGWGGLLEGLVGR